MMGASIEEYESGVEEKLVRKGLLICMVVWPFLAFSGGACAGGQVLSFDSNNWGTSTWGAFNTIKKFESSGGNPGACLLLKGISGVGGSFANSGFTGDFGAAGYKQIAFDAKVKHWFPNPSQPAPVAYVFVRSDNANDPWCKKIQGFGPVTTQWKRYSVDFDPNWSDAEAQAHGWSIIHHPGATGTAPFKETFHNVFQTGFWIDVIDGGAECHILVDNYSVLPKTVGTLPIMAPIRPIPKSRVKLPAKQPYPVKKR